MVDSNLRITKLQPQIQTEQYERLLDTGISLDGLNKLLTRILDMYKLGGESPNPKEG